MAYTEPDCKFLSSIRPDLVFILFLASWSIRGQSLFACLLTLKGQEQVEDLFSSERVRHASRRRFPPPLTLMVLFCSPTYSHPALCVPAQTFKFMTQREWQALTMHSILDATSIIQYTTRSQA